MSWLREHSIKAHLLAPIWLRVPERWRWRIVDRLNRAQGRCWSSLVDAALAEREDDACDVHLPTGCSASDCARTCYWFGHEGPHDCGCYCGKQRFQAAEGYADRVRTDGAA
jgi:hypothetical protein